MVYFFPMSLLEKECYECSLSFWIIFIILFIILKVKDLLVISSQDALIAKTRIF